jgi:hypothetical protein
MSEVPAVQNWIGRRITIQRKPTGRSLKTVAIDGDTILVAAKSGNYNGPGNVYVFEKTGSQWNQIANLVDANHFQSNSLNDNIAINGDTIVIGNTALASSQGFTYRNVTVYERINGMWSATATITSPDQSGSFGDTVSLDGDALVVSGTELIDVFNSQFVGVDYIYRRINNQWTYEQTIKFDKTSTSTIHVSGDYLVLGGWQPYSGPNGTYFAYLSQRSDDGGLAAACDTRSSGHCCDRRIWLGHGDRWNEHLSRRV